MLAFAINVHSAQFPPFALWSAYPILSSARLILSSARLILSSARLILFSARVTLQTGYLSLIGASFSCSGRKHRAFDQSGPLCYSSLKYLSHLRRFDSSPPKVGPKLKVCFSSTPFSLNVQTITSVSPPLMCCQPPPLP